MRLVFPIHVPPLRECREDILLLAQYFIDRHVANAGNRIRNIDKRTAQLLEAYYCLGNIRELQKMSECGLFLLDMRAQIKCQTCRGLDILIGGCDL